MCGIIAKSFTNPAPAKQVWQDIKRLYTKQKHRGTEGFGYVSVLQDYSVYVKRSTDDTILDTLMQIKKPTRAIMFHHRYPTSTDNLEPCSHPIYVSNPELTHDYYVIHNGVISNCNELKKKHNEAGYKYTTEHKVTTKTEIEYLFSNLHKEEDDIYSLEDESSYLKYNDSEAVAIEIARLIENKIENLYHVYGGYSCIIMKVDKKTNKCHDMYWIRNASNPLSYMEEGDFCGVSEAGKDGVGGSLEGVLYHLDLKTGTMTHSITTLSPSYPPSNVIDSELEGQLFDEYDDISAQVQFERDPHKRKDLERQLKAIEAKLL